MEKQTILGALAAFAAQRPGLEPGNYFSDWRDRDGIAAYRSEVRSITRDLHDVRTLMRAVELRSSLSADQLREGFRAFSGRLTLSDDGRLDYCTGQYWPTEYRKAVCAVLALALWTYWREDAADANAIRKTARNEFGRGLASRWFN